MHDIYYEIAECYNQLTDFKNAIKYYEKSIEYNKENLNGYIKLAFLYTDKLNDSLKGLRIIREAYENNKDKLEIIFNYGLILMKRKEYRRAIEKFDDVLKVNQNYTKAKLAVVQSHLNNNEHKLAFNKLSLFTEEEKENKDYLMLELFCQYNRYEELKDVLILKTILDICDRIIKQYGEDSQVESIKQKIKSTQEGVKWD